MGGIKVFGDLFDNSITPVMGSVRIFLEPNRTEPKNSETEPNRTEPNRETFQKV